MDRQAAACDEPLLKTAHTVDQLSRRRLLAAGASAAVVGMAGCAQVANYIAELVLEDVNLFNQTDRPLAGTISVSDPKGEVVLDETFEVQPETDDEGEQNGTEDGRKANGTEDDTVDESGATYGGVLTEAGSYIVSIALDADSAVDGETDAERSVELADPAEEHIIVVFGADDVDEAIGVFVIEEFTDIGNHVDN